MKKRKILEFLDDYLNGEVKDIPISDLYGENVIIDNCLGRIVGRDSYEKSLNALHQSFPDWHVKTKKFEIIGNTAIVRFEYNGTYSSPYGGMQMDQRGNPECPDLLEGVVGKRISNLNSECTYIFDEVGLIRMYTHSDMKSFYRQLGILPAHKKKDSKDVVLEILQALFPLSKREAHCLALILSGLSAKSAAGVLFISNRTVETHLYKAYEKLQCTSKQQCLEMMLANQTLHLWNECANILMQEKLSKSSVRP